MEMLFITNISLKALWVKLLDDKFSKQYCLFFLLSFRDIGIQFYLKLVDLIGFPN